MLSIFLAVLQAGSIASVTPGASSTLLSIAITGTGFNASAASNEVTFTPAAGGTAITATPSASAALGGTPVLRRLTVTIPGTVPVGRALLQVRNRQTGEMSAGGAIEVIRISLPAIQTAAPGATGVAVRVEGSPNTIFVSGAAKLSFGAGISVSSLVVHSPNSLTATISVAASAAVGPRHVALSGSQLAIAMNAFTVATAAPNQPPVARPGQSYSGTAGQPVAFDASASSDPDAGDTIVSYAWQFGDGTSGTGATPTHVFGSPGPFTASLTVRDNRGAEHAATVPVSITPANTAPVANAGGPYSGTTGQSVAFDGSSSSDPDAGDGIASYTWAFGDGETGSGATPAHSYTTPGTFTVSLTVRDEQGAENVATVSVAIVRANAAPVANPGGPYNGTAGQSVQFDGSQSDDDDNDPLSYEWTFGDGGAAVGETVTHTYANAGALVGVLTVTDGHGGTHTQTFNVTVSPAALGRGVLTGRVFDDATSLPVAGATVQLLNADGSPAPALSVTSDPLGRYRLSASPGPARLRVTKDDSTIADLRADVTDGRRTDPDDARLTTLDSGVAVVSAVAGGTVVSAAGTRLVVPPGALVQDQLMRVTDITAQGPVRHLPLGWTPVAFVDVSGVVQFGSPASLTARVALMPAAGRNITAARWDASTAAWLSIGSASRRADGSGVEAAIPQSGQYAFAVDDLPPDNPPGASIGLPLTGVAPRAPPPPDVQLALSPSPRVLFAQPGARSAVTGTAIPSLPLPSGTPLFIDLAETFTYANGSTLKPWPVRRRFSMFRSDGDSLAATFMVGPSRTLAPFSLRQGAIDIAGRVPLEPGAPRGRVLGAAGGDFTATGGMRVVVPAGAGAEDLPIDLVSIPADEFPLVLPTGASLLRALALDLHGALLTRDVVVSIPTAEPLPSGSVAVVAQLVDIGDATRMVLVATATRSGDSLVSTIDPLGDSSVDLPGLRSEGRYAFLQLDGALGYITGFVSANGSPIGGALIEIAGGAGLPLPLAAVSDSNGRYVLLASPGIHSVRVTNPANGDSTTVSVQVEAGTSVTDRSVPIGPSPPTVIAMSPVNGAGDVALGSGVTVTFSEPVDPASINAAAALSAGGVPFAGSISLSPGNSVLTFLPSTLLQSDTQYEFSLAATVRDLAGYAMAAPFFGSFRTLDVTPPAAPAAGTVVAAIPDALGNSTITGAPGTADPAGTVIVVNLRTNARTTLTPNADGSFTGIVVAQRTDRLELTICDGALRSDPQENICGATRGNPTTIPVPPFRSADGSVVVGAAGGRVEGAGGVVADIPPGALPDGTVVRLEALAAASFPLSGTADFSFAGGIRLDLGGVKAQREIDLSLPAPPGETGRPQILVVRPMTYRGENRWTLLERAHLLDGRYRTASPPFPGIVDSGSYAFLRAEGDCLSYVSITWQFHAEAVLLFTVFPFVFPIEFHQVTLPAYCGSQLQVQVADPNTGAVLQSISYTAPNVADDILFPPDVLTDDSSSPEIVSINNPTGNEVEEIHIRFNKSLNAGSVAAHFTVKDEDGTEVPGSIELAASNTRVIFRPNTAFQLGERYTVTLAGLTDDAGNLVLAQPLTFTPYGPRSLSPLTVDLALAAALQKCSVAGCTSSAPDVAFIGKTLFVANGVRRSDEQYNNPATPRRLLAVDVTDPFHPVLIGWHATTTNPRALAAVSNVNLVTGSTVFVGDLLLVAGGGRVPGGELDGKVEVWDVSGCTTRPLPDPVFGLNCLEDGLRGHKLLSTAAGTPPRPNVPPDSGIPLQISVLHQKALLPVGDTLLAYLVTPPVGLEVVDIKGAFNFPSPDPSSLGPDGLLRGDFSDVAVLKNRVVTVGRDLENQIQLRVLTAQLADIDEFPQPPTPLAPPQNAARIGIAENVVFDLDRDGNLGTAEDEDNDDQTGVSEIFDLAIVASGGLTEGCVETVPCGELYIYDLSQHTDLAHGPARYLDSIRVPGAPFSIAIDSVGRRAYVELRGHGIAIVDLGFLLHTLRDEAGPVGFIDEDEDGRDDRVLAIVPVGSGQDIVVARIKVDFERGVAYVNGGTTGVQTVQVANKANELALDFGTESVARENDWEREKRILTDVITGAVNAVRAGLGVGSDFPIGALEQGSGSCFWRDPFDDDPDRTCPAFQPGTSDHDVEIFIPRECAPFSGDCVKHAQSLLNQFVESDDAEDMGIAELGDLSLFAMPREAFENAELLVGTPLYGDGVSDATGDLGMGRQLLLLLWILEGEYVTGLRAGLPELADLLEQLRNKGTTDPVIPVQNWPAGLTPEPSSIPRLEGLEWALLHQFNAYSTGAMLRVKGGCNAERAVNPEVVDPSAVEIGNDPISNFNEQGFLGETCEHEIHSVAKYAIRSVMAKITGHDRGNALILQIDPVGNAHRSAYRRGVNGACLDGDFSVPFSPGATYSRVPCTGFEHYMLSVAVRTFQQVPPITPSIFDPAQLPLIYSFYCLKVGCPDAQALIRNDQDADRFVRNALLFIRDVQTATRPIYEATVRRDTKPIGQIPLLNQGPGTGPGISQICSGILQQNANFVTGFLLPGNPFAVPPVPAEPFPAAIDASTPRKFLRLCNYLIVSRKINGDDTVQNPAGAGPHVQLNVSRGDLKKRLGVKNYVDWNLQVRALNLGTRVVDVDLRLYEGPGDDPDTYTELKRYPPEDTGQEPDEDEPGPNLVLGPGERRIYATEPAPTDEDPERTRPMFPLLFNLSRPELTGGQPRAIVFFLNPERTIPEFNIEDNQASFFYYVLNLDSDTQPSPSDEPPSPPIDDVEPDPLAIELARMSFTVTANRQGAAAVFGGKQISVGLYQPVQIKYELRNRSSKKLTNVWVMREGVVVATLPSLDPAGQPGDHATLTDSQVYIPTQAGTRIERRTATAVDEDDNTVGLLNDFVSITATDAIQAFSVQLWDASPLFVAGHPFNRFSANHDVQDNEIPLVGATTDGDVAGGGGRIRVEINGLQAFEAATISLVDMELPDATEGLGWLQVDAQTTVGPVVVTADGSGHAVLYYQPPSVFVRDAHRADDLPKVERYVGIRVIQPPSGSSLRRVILRRPPVFLVHGLFSDRDTWSEFQPLVPASGVSDARYVPVKGFDGRFDMFAVGSPFASKPMAEGVESLETDIRLSLAGYLPGFAIGRVDVLAHSMGGLLTRKLANKFVVDERPMPFRKLIAMDSPFQGSQLATKIGELRDDAATKQMLQDTARDLLKALTPSAAGGLDFDLKRLIDIDFCAFGVQAIGMTPRFFTDGAVRDMEVGSAELLALQAFGITIPSHHVVGITSDPILGVSTSVAIGTGLLNDVALLWEVLGLFCNLTPDADTLAATVLVQTGADMALAAASLSQSLKKVAALLPGRIPLRNPSAGLVTFMKRFGPFAKLSVGQAHSSAPVPVFSTDNDRIVESASQIGGLPINGVEAVSVVQGYTDHTAILESTGIPVSACDLSPASLPPPQPLNSDTVPDVVCRVIHLLESPPSAPHFVKDP